MDRSRQTLHHYKRKLVEKAEKFNRPMPFPDYLRSFVNGATEIRIADLGAGPFPIIGSVLDGIKVEIIASDILADEFMKMLIDAGIVPFTLIDKQDMEHLTYRNESFDIVHCVNALDHVLDPGLALKEMYRVCKTGGTIYLRHFINGAEFNKYRGFHSWNINLMDGECEILGRDKLYLTFKNFPSFEKTNHEIIKWDNRDMIVSTLVK